MPVGRLRARSDARTARHRPGEAGLRRARRRTKPAEVAVVADRFDRLAKRRVDKTARARRGLQRDPDHLGERGRNGDDGARRAVDAAQLAVRAKAAEGSVALREKALDRARLGR
jgi:hypothetical protein